MFSSFGSSGSFFVMPVCYHPTTIINVDDDPNFSSTLSNALSNISIVSFTNADAAISYVKNNLNHHLFTERCLKQSPQSLELVFSAIRNEIYNPNRFKAVVIIIPDYDMPDKNGLELINTMEFPPELQFNTYIMVTGEISSKSDPRIAGKSIANSLILKSDPDFINQILTMITDNSQSIFQWYSYMPARILAANPLEKTSFLFDKNCVQLLDNHVQKNKICEMYLFDKQGSYLFLDKDANLSWMFVRSEKGIENTIKRASQYKAPQSVIDALKSREVILSIYEEEDFERIKPTQWDPYLLPATAFNSNNTYVEQLGVSFISTYYYAFTKDFPEHGIDQSKILSYQTFLNKNESP